VRDKNKKTAGVVTFRNSQGIAVEAVLVNIANNYAVFEVYNSYSIVQLSEELTDIKIFKKDELVYSGKGSVSGILSVGSNSICSVDLVDNNFIYNSDYKNNLEKEINQFLINSEKDFYLKPSFISDVFKIALFFQSVKKFVSKLNLYKQDDFLKNSLNPLIKKGLNCLDIFEKTALKIEPKNIQIYKKFVQKTLHPLLLCSPFIFRTFAKPLGFAGDYEMVNMILREPFEGKNLYAKLINGVFLSSPVAVAHRNRIEIITEKLKDLSKKKAENNKQLQALNIGCGPAKEIEDFIKEKECSELFSFKLLDFNIEALGYAEKVLKKRMEETGKKVNIEFIQKSVREILRSGIKDKKKFFFDFIYCAGLFDYLSDNICKRLIKIFLSRLKPDGELLITNVHKKNPHRYVIEYILEWNLIYRDEEDIIKLIPVNYSKKVYTDFTGGNTFWRLKMFLSKNNNGLYQFYKEEYEAVFLKKIRIFAIFSLIFMLIGLFGKLRK